MPTREELQQAIELLESQAATFETCQKLAVYHYLYDKCYNKIQSHYTSDSEFMDAVADVGIDDLLAVIDELMECVSVINPKLYDSVLEKIRAH